MPERLSILVVDPDPLTLQTVTEAVQGCQAVVTACDSPDAVLATARDKAAECNRNFPLQHSPYQCRHSGADE